jgi:hypothetical protein
MSVPSLILTYSALLFLLLEYGETLILFACEMILK